MDTTEKLENVAATLRRLLEEIEQQKGSPNDVWLRSLTAQFRTLAGYIQETP